jgi:TRAP-type mannitol/chloroaromatic compound transport system substrate-binding protein
MLMNRKRIFITIGFLCMALVLVATTFLGACAEPSSNGVTKTTTVTTTATTTKTQAPTEDVFEWDLQAMSGAGIWIYDPLILTFCDQVREMSNGRLDLTPYPANALVPVDEIADAVSMGTIPIAFGHGNYWTGKIPAARIENPPPFTVRSQWEMDILFWELGWNEIFREAYAEHNIYYAGPCCGIGYLVMSTSPINSLDDMRQLKIRTIGLTAETLEAAGVPTVYIPGGEIYTGLATGVIDGATWGGAKSEYDMKFYEVCDYICTTYVTGAAGENMIVNLDAWNSLPSDLQKIIEMATRELSMNRMRHYWVAEGDALAFMLDYGLTATQLPPEDIAELTAASLGLVEELVAEDPGYTAQAVEILNEFMEKMGYS